MATVSYPAEADRPVSHGDDPGLWDVLSVRDEDGQPSLGNCHLQVGDHLVEFVHGVGKAPEEILDLLALDKRIRIPGWGRKQPDGHQFSPDAMPQGIVQVGGAHDPDLDAVRETVAQDDAIPKQQGATRPGKGALTKDGQPRCQAVKANGTQCENSVVDGGACGLGAHRSQLS